MVEKMPQPSFHRMLPLRKPYGPLPTTGTNPSYIDVQHDRKAFPVKLSWSWMILLQVFIVCYNSVPLSADQGTDAGLQHPMARNVQLVLYCIVVPYAAFLVHTYWCAGVPAVPRTRSTYPAMLRATMQPWEDLMGNVLQLTAFLRKVLSLAHKFAPAIRRPQTFDRFALLPIELQLKICSYATEDEPRDFWLLRDWTRIPNIALRHLSQSIRDEVTDTYWRSGTFHFVVDGAHPSPFLTFLQELGPRHVGHLRKNPNVFVYVRFSEAEAKLGPFRLSGRFPTVVMPTLTLFGVREALLGRLATGASPSEELGGWTFVAERADGPHVFLPDHVAETAPSVEHVAHRNMWLSADIRGMRRAVAELEATWKKVAVLVKCVCLIGARPDTAQRRSLVSSLCK